MTFTRRTYRLAIRRAIRKERYLRRLVKYAGDADLWVARMRPLLAQINLTRRLQQRKRRERK